ncbi:MAG: hypothetical protein RIR79_416 [Pseudomonadota bacterium]|jgi:hypothetical protein
MKTMDFETGIEDKIGRKIGMRLSGAGEELPYDITERLRVARMQALSKRKVVVALSAASDVNASYSGVANLYMGDMGNLGNKWLRLGALLPFLLFFADLIGIPMVQDDLLAYEVASVDVELLSDELPPAAYTDQGFIHFLNLNTHRHVSE